jgi:hypothetical protein
LESGFGCRSVKIRFAVLLAAPFGFCGLSDLASKITEDTVEAYLTANWDTTACPILTENDQGSAPSDGSPFLVVEYPVSSNRRVSVSTRFYVEEGGLRIQINVERGQGTAKIREYGETLAGLLRDKYLPNGVRTLAPSEPFTDDRSDQGNYWRGYVTCEFAREYTD